MNEETRLTESGVLAVALSELLQESGTQYKPTLTHIERKLWEHHHVVEVFENVWPVIRRLPGNKLSAARSHMDIAAIYAETTAAKVAPEPYHVDQLQDAFEWVMWLTTIERRVLWTATSYTGYQRHPWTDIAKACGVTVRPSHNSKRNDQRLRRRVKGIYSLALAKICQKLNETQYPHRGPRPQGEAGVY